MNREFRSNAVRSGIVVISALAFGYLTFQIGFKPYLQKAELLRQQQETAITEETLANDSQYLPGQFQQNPISIDRLDDEEKLWWELWDRRRKMAAAQVVCYAANAIYILNAYYQSQCNDSVFSNKERKRKVRQWERKFGSLKKAVTGVAEAIKEGDHVVERSQRRIYTDREVYAELVKIGVERQWRYSAYSFLTHDPVRVRAFFGFPVDERKHCLLQMMLDLGCLMDSGC